MKRLNLRGTGFCSRVTRQFDARSLASNLTLDNDASNSQNTLPAMEVELEETDNFLFFFFAFYFIFFNFILFLNFT